MSKTNFKAVFRDTLPVLAGYLVLGMGFGIVMHANGYGLWPAAAMSLFIYAGSMQYAAIGLFTGGVSMLTVALTTLAVNARHLFYGISMVNAYRDAGVRKPYLIFGLTDETYSLVCTGEKDLHYCFLVTLLNHSYWVAGTVLGSVLGNAVRFNTEGVDFALTALFITIFTDQWTQTKDHFAALTGVLVSVLCLVLFGQSSFLIPAMAGILTVLLLRMGKEARHAGT